MDTLGFSAWVSKGGAVFSGDVVSTQTASSQVKVQAGGNSTSPSTEMPSIHRMDIGIVETGIARDTAWEAIDKPTIHQPFTHQVEGEAKIADENIDIFTPGVNLTDIFSTNMNPY